MKEIIFTQTTTIGLREYTIQKSILPRKEIMAETKYGQVRVKQCLFKGKVVRSKPESDDCRNIALRENISMDDVEREVFKAL
jgi:uncharacterized protein (DUF111 family)